MNSNRATITRDIVTSSPTRPRLSRSDKTHNIFAERISFAEHWELVAESSELHLTLNRAHFFPARKTQKSGTFFKSEKRESGMARKKLESTPESGNVDTYVL